MFSRHAACKDLTHTLLLSHFLLLLLILLLLLTILPLHLILLLLLILSFSWPSSSFTWSSSFSWSSSISWPSSSFTSLFFTTRYLKMMLSRTCSLPTSSKPGLKPRFRWKRSWQTHDPSQLSKSMTDPTQFPGSKTGFAIITGNNPTKLERPWITKGQYLAIFRVDFIM